RPYRPRAGRRPGQLGAGRRASPHAPRIPRRSQRGVTMSVTVSIPTPLRSFTGGRDAVDVSGATVGEVLDGLLAVHTGLKRHLVLPEVGVEGQRKLKAARVLTIGAGGLGSPLSLYLAAAGVGTIGIVDFDVVDLTNLQRQIVHGTATLGTSKLESAKARLGD